MREIRELPYSKHSNATKSVSLPDPNPSEGLLCQSGDLSPYKYNYDYNYDYNDNDNASNFDIDSSRFNNSPTSLPR